MAGTIIMPQLGETVAEGKIVSWFKAVGDTVAPGDRLFEVETDKVTIDVEAIEGGTLTRILVGDGATAGIGAVVAELNGAAAAPAPQPAAAATAVAPAPQAPAAAVAQPAPSAPRELSVMAEVSTARGLFGRAATDGIRITPLARRLAAERGLSLAALAGKARSLGLSRIGERELHSLGMEAAAPVAVSPVPAVEMPARPLAPAPVVTPATGDEVIPFSTIRQKTADRLAQNWQTIPHVFQAIEVDFTDIDAVRQAQKGDFKARHGLSLTFLPFIVRATAMALREFPDINARTDGRSLIRSRDVNIGIAVDLDHKGLVVPVLRNADELTVPGIAKGIGRLVEKARAGKLGADDMAGGTYSITNNGAFGTHFTAPIINAPQVAILSTDAIRLRPGVVSTPAGDFVAPRLLGMVGQSFDHRAFDGAYAAAFLSRLKTLLETRPWAREFD